MAFTLLQTEVGMGVYSPRQEEGTGSLQRQQVLVLAELFLQQMQHTMQLQRMLDRSTLGVQ
jgi:hypothetical protein